MTPTHTFRWFFGLIAAAAMGAPVAVDAATFPHPVRSAVGHHVCACPQCHHTCRFEAKPGEEEKECFDVESEVVCIPRVVFPWQKRGCDPCVNNGARLRRVCVLKTETYNCPKCEYSWTPVACATVTSTTVTSPTLATPTGGRMIGGCDLDGEGEAKPAAGHDSIEAASHAPVWVDLTRFPQAP